MNVACNKTHKLPFVSLAIADLICDALLVYIYPWTSVALGVAITSFAGYFAAGVKISRTMGFLDTYPTAPTPSSSRFKHNQSPQTNKIAPQQAADLAIGTYMTVLFLIPGPATTLAASAILIIPQAWQFLASRVATEIEAQHGNPVSWED